MPGTTPTYWATADDRLTATMIAVLEEANRPAGPPPARRRVGG